jgi:hypothetical protein
MRLFLEIGVEARPGISSGQGGGRRFVTSKGNSHERRISVHEMRQGLRPINPSSLRYGFAVVAGGASVMSLEG